MNDTHGAFENLDMRSCNHIFGTYIIPNLLHFFAFLIGFYHFRIQEHEGLYALMEKVIYYFGSPTPIHFLTLLN